MSEVKFLAEVGFISLAALVGGLAARRLGQPAILGYLVAGVLVGPHTPGFVADDSTTRAVAEWGVVFLMFAVGVEFSIKSLSEVRKVGTLAGLVQITLSIVLGYAVGRSLGLAVVESIYLGCIIAMSSTMIVMKLLDDRGEMDSFHGKVMLGILIIQDLAVVVMAGVLPILSGLSIQKLPLLGLNVLKAGAYLALAMLLAVRVLPYVFRAVAAARSRELFVLSVVGIAFGAAVGTDALGFSLALGAFVAGLIVSESDYSHQILAEVKPFRDVFASLFFVSIGMLVDPRFVVNQFWAVTAVVSAVVIGKFLMVFLLALGLRLHGRVAIVAGLGLAQIGEFSLVLAQIGVARAVMTQDLYSLTLATVLVTMFLSPFLPRLAPWLYRAAGRIPTLRNLMGLGRAAIEGDPRLAGQIILCGYGRVGKRIGLALEISDLNYVVIDYDHYVARTLRERGQAAIYGDASNPEILNSAGAKRATAALVTLPDPVAAGLAVQYLRESNRRMLIVARAHNEEDVQRLYDAGADSVVWPEMEAGVEMIRRTASGLGMDAGTVENVVQAVRDRKPGE